MLLTPERADDFHRYYHSLLAYANKRLGLVPKVANPHDIYAIKLDDIAKVRNGLYDNPGIIDDFVRDNPCEFAAGELDTILHWKHFVRATFYVVKQLKDYAVFLSDEKPPRVYGVVELNDTIEDMTGLPLPVMLKAVLLPFDGAIIHDGLFNIYRIFFGGGLRKSIKLEYEEAKSRFGIITSLPFAGGKQQRSDADLLRFYMKSEESREQYWDEISDLTRKSADLNVLFEQEM